MKEEEKRTGSGFSGGQIIGSNLLKNIGSRIKNTMLYHQKRLYDSLKNTKNVRKFSIEGHPHISYVNNISFTPVAPPGLHYVTSGAFNSIYRTKDSKYAYRIGVDAIEVDSDKAHELILEMLLTIRLSKLGISPKVIDAFFVKTQYLDGPNTYSVMITEYSKNGSLSSFFDSPKCTLEVIPNLVSQSVELYKKMVKNNVFCTDVKPGNMLVTESQKLYLIDFDDTFCAYKESGMFNGEHTYKYAKTLCELWKPDIKNSDEIVQKGFLGLNLLQVAVVAVSDMSTTNTDIALEYARQLVSNNIEFTKDELASIVLCSYIPVSREWNGYTILKHYFIGMDEPYMLNDKYISDDPVTIILGAYLLCTVGKEDCIQILASMSVDDKLLKVSDNSGFPVFDPMKYWKDKRRAQNARMRKNAPKPPQVDTTPPELPPRQVVTPSISQEYRDVLERLQMWDGESEFNIKADSPLQEKYGTIAENLRRGNEREAALRAAAADARKKKERDIKAE